MYPMHQLALVLCTDLGNKIKSATPGLETLPSQQQHRHDKQTIVYLQQFNISFPSFFTVQRGIARSHAVCTSQQLWHVLTKKGGSLPATEWAIPQ